MSPEFHSFLLDVAGNTPFIAFLLYNWWDARKTQEKNLEKLDSQNREYHTKLDQIRIESRQEEEKLRDRYQVVIADLAKDRDALLKVFDAKISDLEKKLESLERAIKKIFVHLDELKGVKDTVAELKIKEEIKEKMNG